MSKIALLMGLNYEGSDSELNGCINDIENVSKMLTSVYEYEEKNVLVMTDHTDILPTRRNITAQLIKLAERTYEEDISEVWISYSGHGTYIKDTGDDEDDGRDECLVPLDYYENGLIDDDTLNHILALINPDVRLMCVIDACHSETILDLPYRYISGNKNVIENPTNNIKCQCIMISGCRDDQTSSDAYDINNSKEYSGAMTSALLHVLDAFDYTITCWRLLKEMKKFLKRRDFTQVPQISSTQMLNCAMLFSCVDPNPFVRVNHAKQHKISPSSDENVPTPTTSAVVNI
jgi:hypothetical protein